MVVVLVVGFTLAWFEQEVTGAHLKDSASETPNVSRSVILGANNNFRRAILSRLNFRGKVPVSPAPVSHVADFNLHIFTQSGPTFHLSVVLTVSLHFLLAFVGSYGRVNEVLDDFVDHSSAVLGSMFHVDLLFLGYFLSF